MRSELKQRALEILGRHGRKILERIRRYDLELVESHFEGETCECRFARRGTGTRGGRMRNIRDYALTAEQLVALLDLNALRRR